MSAVRKTVTLHETTVQKVAKNAIMLHRKPRKAKRPSNSRVQVSHWSDGVDPLIVRYIEQNQIHHSRIEVISPGVIIINNEGV